MKWVVFILGIATCSLAWGTMQAQEKKDNPAVVVDEAKKTVSVDAKIAPRKLPNLDQVYPIELIAGWSAPRGKKAHEIVVTVDVDPSEVHKGLEKLGLKPGKPAKGEDTKAEGPVVNVFMEIPDPAGGTRPTGTGNVTAMLSRGYLEILFKTSDTPLSREFDAALARHAGLHLAAFAVADAAKAHLRLAADGFRVRELVHMQRPVDTESGAATAAFTIARLEPGEMPEGRIQMLTHRTENSVWQERWLKQPNSATALIDVVIVVEDVEAAAARFTRFTGRAATRTPGGALIRLDRGGVYLVSHHRASERLPEVAITALPFMLGYALRVESLAAAEMAVDGADLEWHAFENGIAAAFPTDERADDRRLRSGDARSAA